MTGSYPPPVSLLIGTSLNANEANTVPLKVVIHPHDGHGGFSVELFGEEELVVLWGQRENKTSLGVGQVGIFGMAADPCSGRDPFGSLTALKGDLSGQLNL